MKIILTQDVEKLGHAMDVVEVADGYARNFLFPRSLAMPANKGTLANLENLRRIEEGKQAKLKVAAQEKSSKLDGQTLLFEDANVGSEGRLYGSIGTANLADALKAQFDVEVDRHQILLNDPIRSEGFYTVPLKLHRDVTVQMKVKVGHPSDEAAASESTGESSNEEAPAEREPAEVAA